MAYTGQSRLRVIFSRSRHGQRGSADRGRAEAIGEKADLRALISDAEGVAAVADPRSIGDRYSTPIDTGDRCAGHRGVLWEPFRRSAWSRTAYIL
jgi:hypothetical protein